MKKFISLLVSLVLVLAIGAAMTGCSKGTYKAVKITGIEVEEYGFAIAKTATNKTTVLAAMNEVIEELGNDKIINQLTYHSLVEQDKASEATAAFSVPAATASTANGTLVMYTNAEFPPYEYVTSAGVKGLDVDIMNLVANKLGMAFSVVNQDFDSLGISVTSLETGKTKVIAAGMTITDERKETLDFSAPYMSSVQYMVCEENAAFTTLADLKGKKIGVQLGTTGDFLIDAALSAADSEDPESENGILYNSDAKLVQYKSAALAFAALKAGKIDVVVIDEHPANSLINNQ